VAGVLEDITHWFTESWTKQSDWIRTSKLGPSKPQWQPPRRCQGMLGWGEPSSLIQPDLSEVVTMSPIPLFHNFQHCWTKGGPSSQSPSDSVLLSTSHSAEAKASKACHEGQGQKRPAKSWNEDPESSCHEHHVCHCEDELQG